MSALVLLALAACSRTPGAGGEGPCADPATEEIGIFCQLDEATALARAGEPERAGKLCEALGTGPWRRDCHFRIAESLAQNDRVPEGWNYCMKAGGAARLCLGHITWIGAENFVAAAPSDASAQQKIDAVIALMPERPDEAAETRWRSPEIARAAAWHGVYAGSGSADPTAARAARPDDAAYAHGGFAWEAVRLFGIEMPLDSLIDAVLLVWDGRLSPPRGEPLPQRCWPARPIPRPTNDRVISATMIRNYPSGSRLVSQDAEGDLIIAVVEAAWTQGMDLTWGEIHDLLESRDTAVRRSGAKQAALMPSLFPDLATTPGSSDADALTLAEATRTALEANDLPRVFKFEKTEDCPK